MNARHAAVLGMVAVVAVGCGGSDDDASDAATDGTAIGSTTPAGTAEAGDGDGDEATGTEATPPVVGSIVQGTAVASVLGGDDPAEQSGDVTREDQTCTGRNSLDGLVAGAPVTIRDASGAVVATGSVESTSAVQISDSSDGSPPLWECSFHIVAEGSAPAGPVTVQIADVAPFAATIDDDGGFRLELPVDGTVPGTETTPPTDTTEPPVDVSTTTATVSESVPPPDSFVTSPPST